MNTKKMPRFNKPLYNIYVNIVLIPQIRAVARSVVGRYTPEQLYSTKRDAIQQEIYEETQKVVEGQYIQLNAVLVRDVTLPQAIKEAIERKLRQEQEALEYEFRIAKSIGKQIVNACIIVVFRYFQLI